MIACLVTYLFAPVQGIFFDVWATISARFTKRNKNFYFFTRRILGVVNRAFPSQRITCGAVGKFELTANTQPFYYMLTKTLILNYIDGLYIFLETNIKRLKI